MDKRLLLKLLLFLVCALGALSLASFFTRPSMDRNALLFGQSLGKLVVGGLFFIPLLGVVLLFIYSDRVGAYIDQKLVSTFAPGVRSFPSHIAWRVYIVVIVLISAIGIILFTSARFWETPFNPIQIGFARTRYLLLWIGMVLLMLPAIVFLGLSSSSWAVFTKLPPSIPAPILNTISWKDALLVSIFALITVAVVYQYA
jgi:hypothetical protein